MSHFINRKHYADIFGPTTGDQVRLGDTALIAEVEKDSTVYGDECKFGGGKVIREGMGQAAGVGDEGRARLRHHQRAHRRLDRHLQGRHRHQGRTHRRHRQGRQSRRDGGRRPNGMIVGVTTEVIAGEGLILTAGGIDSHIHFICPQQAHEAHRERRHHVDRRRHWPGDRHERHDLHARRAPCRTDAAGDRCAADELRFHRQRQHRRCPRACRANSRRRDRSEAARRLGHRRPRRLIAA